MGKARWNLVRLLPIILVLTIWGLPPASVSTAGVISNDYIKTGLDKWQELNLVNVQEELSKLPTHEKIEQVRDWMALALLKKLDLDKTQLAHLVFDMPSSRVDALASLNSYKYGPVRSFILPTDEVTFIALLPHNKGSRDEYLGRVADEVRMTVGRKPDSALIFEYELDISTPIARFKYTGKVTGDVLYSSRMGYSEAHVTKLDHLDHLLKAIDVLSLVELTQDGLLLGGRRISGKESVAIGLDDIAAIYQADRQLKSKFIERVRTKGVQEEYYSFLRERISEQFSEISSRHPGKTFEDILAQAKTEYTYDQFRKEFIEALLPSVGANIGFSLDPHPQAVRASLILGKARSGDASTMKDFVEEKIGAPVRFQLSEELEELFPQFVRNYTPLKFATQNSEGSTTNQINGAKAGEIDLTTLIGLESSIPVRASSPVNDRHLSSTNNEASVKDAWKTIKQRLISEEVESFSARFLDQIVLALHSQKEALEKVQKGLSRNDWKAYREYRRYLRGEAEVSAKKGTKGYAIRDAQDMLREAGFNDVLSSGKLDDLTASALKSYQKRTGLRSGGNLDPLTWKHLLSKSENKAKNFKAVDALLGYIDKRTSYQCARYDGDLKGTEVGMTLFYTDLMMKLWSMDYPGSFPPTHIPGFIPISKDPVSPVYWDEVEKYPMTRGWLGPLEEGYEFFNDDSGLSFGSVATKIYNASSSDLYPGQEVPANAPSERFSREWNLRYLDVSDYEPQFHRLNEIMKWSIAIRWLKNKESDRLGFLRNYKVIHSNSFESWLGKHGELKSQTHLPFMNNTGKKESTECLALLESGYFHGLGSTAHISGGVSLGSSKDLISKLGVQSKKSKLPFAVLRKGIDHKNVEHLEKSTFLAFLNGKSARIDAPKGKVEFAHAANATFRGKDGDFNKPTLVRSFGKDETTLRLGDEISNHNLGEIVVVEDGGVLNLTYVPRDINKAYQVVKQMLSEFASREQALIENEYVEDLLRLPDRNGLLVKLTNVDQWLLITRQETPLAGKYKHLIRLGATEDDVPQVRQAGFIGAQEVGTILKDANWQKIRPADFASGDQISESSITLDRGTMLRKNLLAVFDRKGPNEGTSVQILYKGEKFDATVDEEALFLQNLSGTTIESLLRSKPLREGLNARDLLFINRNLKDIEDATTLVRLSSNGDPIVLGKNEIRPDTLEILKPVLLRKSKAVQGLVIHDYPTRDMQIRPDGVIKVPRTVSQEQVNELVAVMDVLDQDPTVMKKIAEIGSLNREVISHFVRLPENMRESYLSFAQLKALPRDYAVVDLGGTLEKPQWIFSSQAGHVEVRDLPESLISHYSEIREGLDNVYRGTEAMDLESLKVMTKPYVEYLESIALATQARTIVTRGDEFIDSNMIWQLHNKSSQVQFKRDQASLEKSILNAESLVEYHDARTFIGSSVSFSVPPHPQFENVRNIASSIEKMNHAITSNLTWAQLKELLMDKEHTQVHLIVRVDDEKWFVFRDRRVHWLDVMLFLDSIPEKDLLHLVSNSDQRLVELLATSGRFKRLVLSQYALGDRLGFERALENIFKFIEAASQEFVVFDVQEYEALLAAHPSFISTLRMYEYRHMDSVLLGAGALLRRQGESLPVTLTSAIRERIDKRDKYLPRIDAIISKIGKDKIDAFSSPAPSTRELLLSFPKLKVQLFRRDLQICQIGVLCPG